MMRQKGFVLLEVAIVVVVILIMSSLLATTFFQAEEDRRNEQVIRQMETIKKAVLDYAAANKTATRYVEAVNVSVNAATGVRTTVTQRWTLPAGRPYLPCPDIDGDGWEDRFFLTAPSSVITLSVAAVSGQAYATGYLLERFGHCTQTRGILPWRTLKTPAADPWGRYYTFRSAGIFSNALAGFDENTRANSVYKTRPLMPAGEGEVRAQSFNRTTSSGPFRISRLGTPVDNLRVYPSPALICGGFGGCFDNSLSVSVINSSVLVAGAVPDGERLTDPRIADFDGSLVMTLGSGGVASGIPFVVVSHGKNGYGGVRVDSNRGSGYVCEPFPVDSANAQIRTPVLEAERQNAYRHRSFVEDSYNCPAVSPMMGGEFGFVAGLGHGSAPNSGGVDAYDDIVGWMTMEEIVAGLTERGAFPAPPWPPIGLEQ